MLADEGPSSVGHAGEWMFLTIPSRMEVGDETTGFQALELCWLGTKGISHLCMENLPVQVLAPPVSVEGYPAPEHPNPFGFSCPG